jgi:hypothetical protein
VNVVDPEFRLRPESTETVEAFTEPEPVKEPPE